MACLSLLSEGFARGCPRGDAKFPHRGNFAPCFFSLVPPSAGHLGRSKKQAPLGQPLAAFAGYSRGVCTERGELWRIFQMKRIGKMKKREAGIKRKTRETEISVKVNIDGAGKCKIKSGIGFLDHMLELFAFHGFFDLNIQAKGDLNVDIHHTNEDIGICLGQVFKKALGDCIGIARLGSSDVPMDKSRARVAIDISNRYAFSGIRTPGGTGPYNPIDGYSLHDAEDFLDSFAKNMGISLHIDVLAGDDLHHALEAVFKAFGDALDKATKIDPRRKGVPSTKGVL